MVTSDRGSNHRSTNSTSPSKCSLTGDEHIRYVLILTKERQVKDDLQGLSISCHHNKLGDTAVQSLGCFVGTFTELLVVTGLLDEVKDRVGQGSIGKW